MNVAIIWTDLAESNIPLDSSWRELKEGGGRGVFVGMGEYVCPLSEFQKPVVSFILPIVFVAVAVSTLLCVVAAISPAHYVAVLTPCALNKASSMRSSIF